MKKIISIVLCLSLTMFLFACNKKEKGNTETDTSVTEGVANPMVPSTEEEIKTVTGADFNLSSKFQSPNFFLINNKIGQVGFKYKDLNFTFRTEKSDKSDDISGMYYEWTESKTVTIDNCKGELHIYSGKDEFAASVIWYDSENGVMYTLSTDKEISDKELLACADLLVK